MKTFALCMLAALSVPLGACNNSPTEKLADRVESAADNRADAMESNADAMRSQAAALDSHADAVRDTGDSRADAIKAADMNVASMSADQRDAIVASQAPAVR